MGRNVAELESAAYNCYCGGGSTTDYCILVYVYDSQIIQAGIELLVSLIYNLPTIIIEIVKAVPQIIAALVRASQVQSDRPQVGGNHQGIMAGFQMLEHGYGVKFQVCLAELLIKLKISLVFIHHLPYLPDLVRIWVKVSV